MTREQEAAILDKCIDLMTKLSGKRPTGYVAPWWELSTVTNELLLERGIKYDHSLPNRSPDDDEIVGRTLPLGGSDH
jgi:peptidoglycan-N-acetylglucosamine deacetylase